MAKTELGKAYVQIVPSAEGISGSISNILGDEASIAGESAGTTFATRMGGALRAGGVIAAAGAAALTAAVVKVGKDAVAAYGEYEQLVGGVETLFGDAASTVMANANEAYRTAGLSANEYMQTVTSFSASLLQSTSGNAELAAEVADQALIDMSDNANKMGSSMESIMNAYQGFAKQNYTMLDNLKLGYGGTKTEMERLLADAQAITGIEYNIDNLSDVYNAIHVIQSELGIVGTTAQEAGATLQGSAGQVKAAWKNFVVGLADPSQDISVLLDNLIDSIVASANNFIPRIVQMIPQLINGLSQLVVQLAPQIPPLLQQLVPALLEGLVGLVTAIIEMLPDLIVSIAQTLITLAPIILESIINILMSIGETLLNYGGQFLSSVGQIASNIITTVVNWISQLPEKLAYWAGYAIGKFIEIMITLPRKVTELFFEVIQKVVDFGKNLWENAGNIAKQFVDTLINGIIELPQKFLEIGTNIVNGIRDGIANGWNALVDYVKNLASKLLQGAKDALGIASPSRAFRNELGKWIPAGIALGIEDNGDMVTDAVEDVAANSLNADIPMAMNAMSMGYDNMAVAGMGGELVIPVYIGQEKLDTIILNAQQRHALVSGGR